MSVEKKLKSTVWRSIFRLILPYKNKFLLVVLLSLLSTGATLVEPLIYREAINDVAGLFVKQAKEDVRKEIGIEDEEEGLLPSTNADDSNAATKDSSKKVEQKKAIVKSKNIKGKKAHLKKPK